MKFLNHLLGKQNWINERINVLREKMGAHNIVKEIKQYQEKWLQTTRTEDGHKQDTKTSITI
jgi:hypothetical protein